jgi:hypothetical protein
VTGKVEIKVMRKLIGVGLVLGACLAMTLTASADGRMHGRIFVGPGFGSFGGYDPYFYSPFGPYEFYTDVHPNAGQVQLKTNVKDADVYINGAYAGKAGKLKSMWLRSDTYSLEIRAPGARPYTQKIYVIPGKTIKVEAYFSTAAHT